MPLMKYNKNDLRPIKLISDTGEEYIGKYISARIDPTTIPEGVFAYQCRHFSNGDLETPNTIEKRVVVNFAGTFLTTVPLVFQSIDDPVINIVSTIWGDIYLLTTTVFWKDLTKKKQKEILKFVKEDVYLKTMPLATINMDLPGTKEE